MTWSLETLVERLEEMGEPESRDAMAGFGIRPERLYGVKIPGLRALARETGRDHLLAEKLWRHGFRETMILATMVDEWDLVSETQMENWVLAFYDWEVCDQCVANLFEKTPLAWTKALEWSLRREEFVKRAGFVLMARLAVSDRKTGDQAFSPVFSPDRGGIGR